MNYCRIVIRCMVACILLSGCATQPTSTVTRSVSTMPLGDATTVATSQALVGTSAPQLPETAIPTAPTLVDTLPLTQPWFLHQGNVLAIDSSGAVQQLRMPVDAAISRPSLPPLLLQNSVEHKAIFNPQTGRAISLDVPHDAALDTFVASRNGKYVAIGATYPTSSSGAKSGNRILLLDLTTGTLHTILDGDAVLAANPESALAWMKPLIWDGDTLYTITTISASTVVGRIQVSSRASSPVAEVLTIGETAFPKGWDIALSGTSFAYVSNIYKPELRMRNLQTNHEVTVSNAATPAYALSVDGVRLAFFQAVNSENQSYDVMLYNTATNTATPLVRNSGAPAETNYGSGSVAWFDDAQHLLIVTQQGAQIVQIDAAGKVVGQVNVPAGATHIVDTNQLLVLYNNQTAAYLQVATTAPDGVRNIAAQYWPELIYMP